MAIRVGMAMDISQSELRKANAPIVHTSKHNTCENVEFQNINIQDEINAASEEMADLLSTFGRFSKVGRRNDHAENDFASSILEDKADDKLSYMIKHISSIKSITSFFNYARSLFPNDSDLLLVMRELLHSRKLTQLHKGIIKEAISDIERFCDVNKINSGINIGKLAKRYSKSGFGKKNLSAKDLRNNYLRFLELDLPVSFIYQDWIDEFGCENRKHLLSFTLNALVADMKSSQPGIHYDEFGPLSAKLNDARIINTLDESLIMNINELDFITSIGSAQQNINEEQLLDVYFKGLTNFVDFKNKMAEFIEVYTSNLLIKQRATLLQRYLNVFNLTPNILYSTVDGRDSVQEFMKVIMLTLHKKEIIKLLTI